MVPLPIILKLLWLMGGWFGYCDDKWVRDPSGPSIQNFSTLLLLHTTNISDVPLCSIAYVQKGYMVNKNIAKW